MASFLILNTDLPNAGLEKGDVISVKGDDDTVTTASGTWHWSAQEDKDRWITEGNPAARFPDMFRVLDIPGMSLETARRATGSYFRAATIVDNSYNAPDRADRIVPIGKKRWRFDESQMTSVERADYAANGRVQWQHSRQTINDRMIDRSGLDDFDTDARIDPNPPSR